MKEDKKKKEERKEEKHAEEKKPLGDDEVEGVAGGNIFRQNYANPEKTKGFF